MTEENAPSPSSTQSPLDALDQTLQLAFPPALVQLTQSLMDPMPDFSTISRYLAMDQALTAAVLHIANSPIYGFSLKVTDVQRAAIALGTRELFKLVLSLAIQKRMHGLLKRDPEAQFADWRITLWGAIAAEEIAESLVPQKTAEAYLGTLLKDLPRLLALCREDSPEWLRKSPMATLYNEEQLVQERLLWGVDHTDLASQLLKRWNLADDLTEAVKLHHNMQDVTALPPLARCIALATRWAELLHGSTGGLAPLAAFEATLAATLSLSTSEMENLRQRCTLLFKTLLSQLGIQESPQHTRFYDHTLPTLQNLYFLSLELFAAKNGLPGIASQLRHHLRLHWDIEEWELALRIQGSSLLMFYRCARNTSGLSETGPLEPSEIHWTPGLERFVFTAAGHDWGQLRISAKMGRKSRSTLPLYIHFVSEMLDQYHRGQAFLQKQADTLAAMPLGVARLDSRGVFIDANPTFLRLFDLPVLPQRIPVTALLQYRFTADISGEWQHFVSSATPLYSKILHLRTADPTYPRGMLLLVHRLRDRDNEFLVLLEDADKFSGLQENSIRQSEFVNRIFAALPETLLILDAAGVVTWASLPQENNFVGRSIFNMAKPASNAFQDPWDKSFLVGLRQTTVLDARLYTDASSSTLYELSFTPMPGAVGQATIVVMRDLAAIRHIDDKTRAEVSHDSLTELATYSQFHLALERETDRAAHTGKALGIIFCDLEAFRLINAMYGYQAGDAILRRVAAVIKAVSRKGLDTPARFGSDDFALIVSDANRDMLDNMAAKIRQGVQTACSGSVQMNYGLILFSGGEFSPQQALNAARNACEAARKMPERLVWAEEKTS